MELNEPEVPNNQVTLADPHGRLVTVDPSEVKQSIEEGGYSIPDPKDILKATQKAEFGTVPQQVLTGVEGALKGATAGIFPGFTKNAPIRAETNPWTHGGFEAAGLAATNLIPGIGEAADVREAGLAAKAALKAGQLTEPAAIDAAKAAVQTSKEYINPLSAQSVLSGLSERAASAMGVPTEGILGGAANEGAKMAIQGALYQSGDEISKMIQQDPGQTIGTAAAHIGLAGLMTGALGAVGGGVGGLWDAKFGGKTGQFVEDFSARAKEHLNNPDPLSILSEELHNRYTSDKSIFDEVYGPKGLKNDAIQKLMPEQLSDKMAGQAQDFLKQANHFAQEMDRNPDLYPRNLSARFNRDLRIFSDQLSQPSQPGEVFNALQEFKQRMQSEYGGQFVSKVDPSHDFINGVRNLGSSIRSALEDEEVWGKAAGVQKDINKAFSEYGGGKASPLKQFETKFTTNVNGERIIDPGKLQTYLNQSGKAGQKIKQEMLGNYIEASENYRNAINKTHMKLGIESPLENSSLNYTKSTLQELTPGARLADAFLKKGLNRLTGEVLGAGVGGGVGHFVGAGGFGALIGEHMLGPFFSSILPSIIKPLLEQPSSGLSFKSAVNMGLDVIKGESIINKASKNIFKAGEIVLPNHLIPDEKQRTKLDTQLKKIQTNPETLLNQQPKGTWAHYLPDHQTAVSQTVMNGANFLNGLRPVVDKKSPLDSEMKPSKMAEAQYARALDIAEQPAIVLEHIKDGKLTPNDILVLKTVYPSLYDKFNKTLSHELIETVSRGENIPYRTRMGLSLFMGHPLDSTMTPQSIQSMQASMMMNQPQPQQPAMHAKHSMSALNKMSLTEATPGQARERSRLK